MSDPDIPSWLMLLAVTGAMVAVVARARIRRDLVFGGFLLPLTWFFVFYLAQILHMDDMTENLQLRDFISDAGRLGMMTCLVIYAAQPELMRVWAWAHCLTRDLMRRARSFLAGAV